MSKNNNSDKKINNTKRIGQLENELLTKGLIEKAKQIKESSKDFNNLVEIAKSNIAPETRIKINDDMIKSLKKGGVSPEDIKQIQIESRLKAKDLMPKIEQEFKKRQEQQIQKPSTPYQKETFNKSSSMNNLGSRETIAAARTSSGALKIENNLRDKEQFQIKQATLKQPALFDPKKMTQLGSTNNTTITTTTPKNTKNKSTSQGRG